MKGIWLLVENVRYFEVLKGRKKIMQSCNIKLIISTMS